MVLVHLVLVVFLEQTKHSRRRFRGLSDQGGHYLPHRLLCFCIDPRVSHRALLSRLGLLGRCLLLTIRHLWFSSSWCHLPLSCAPYLSDLGRGAPRAQDELPRPFGGLSDQGGHYLPHRLLCFCIDPRVSHRALLSRLGLLGRCLLLTIRYLWFSSSWCHLPLSCAPYLSELGRGAPRAQEELPRPFGIIYHTASSVSVSIHAFRIVRFFPDLVFSVGAFSSLSDIFRFLAAGATFMCSLLVGTR
jgi:hypothetical protein